MKVLHIYSGNLLGGIERMLLALTALNTSVCSHDFALCFEGKLSRTLQARGATVERLPPARIRNPLSLLRTRAALRRLLNRRRFDAVICHSVWTYCIFAPVAAHAGYARIIYLHDLPEAKNWYYRWAWRMPPRLCIANSRYTGSRAALLRPVVPIEIVYPLVNAPQTPDSTATEALRTQLGAKPDDVVILQASRFDSWKGHRNLLRALHMVRDVPSWVCWIAGAPQRPQEEAYKHELLLLLDSLGITERVKFIGHRDDMEAVLTACDIYCQPNETPEPFGMVFVEALYAGKPAVGSALGGSEEIVSPDCGILCRPDAASVSAALRRLVADDQLRARMSEAGPTRAAQLCGGDQFTACLRQALDAATS
jgi:glycosyltransferase involved in cell wall biosynthesis